MFNRVARPVDGFSNGTTRVFIGEVTTSGIDIDTRISEAVITGILYLRVDRTTNSGLTLRVVGIYQHDYVRIASGKIIGLFSEFRVFRFWPGTRKP